MSKFAAITAEPDTAPAALDTARKRGRPPGKRSNVEEYTQTTAYIRRSTHAAAMQILSVNKYNGKGQISDFSVLVDTLLSEWLEKQNV